MSAAVLEGGRPAAVDMTALVRRVRGEYEEMPGLRLTVPQAARLFGVAFEVARTALDELRIATVLTRSEGTYALTRES